MIAPHRYNLGGRPEVYTITKDLDGVIFVPSEIRISVEAPDGTITTVSGDAVVVSSGYVSTFYKPLTTGWYATEVWVKDGSGREDTDAGGFEVYDTIIGA